MVVLTEGKCIKMLICVTVFLMFISSISAATPNLTCYQCERHTEEECDLNDLKQCSSSFDRCAILIKKDAQEGLTIRRQCGLAPCGFDDEMMAKGLGMNCDRSKDSYSCVSCCRENGCNKNSASLKSQSLLLIFGLLIFCLLCIARDSFPPYVMPKNTYFTK